MCKLLELYQYPLWENVQYYQPGAKEVFMDSYTDRWLFPQVSRAGTEGVGGRRAYGADRRAAVLQEISDIFQMDDVPEGERRAVAREVADKIIAKLKQEGTLGGIARCAR